MKKIIILSGNNTGIYILEIINSKGVLKNEKIILQK